MRKIATIIFFGAVAWNVAKYWPRWDDKIPVPMSISVLNHDSNKYFGQRVRVEGRVSGRLKVLGFTAFVLEDSEGQTLNVAGFTSPPEPGETITVVGDYRLLTMGAFKSPVLYVTS